MRVWPTGRMLSLLAVAMPAFVVINGCNSTTSLPASFSQEKKLSAAEDVAKSKDRVIRPGMELAWAINTDKDQPGLMRSGTALVGPDGTATIGPYGDCKISGLTLAQACTQVEKQLSPYVKQPHVTLAPLSSANEPVGIVWKRAKSGTNIAVAQNAPLPASPTDGSFRPVGFQSGSSPNETLKPFPVVTIKEQEAPPPTSASGVNAGGFHFHHAPPVPIVPPSGPSEMTPVVLPSYTIRPPDVLLIESQKGLLTQPIRGQHLVRPDGTVGVGIYGSVLVAGKTIAQAREDVARAIYGRLDQKLIKIEDVIDGLSVDVLAYNSTVYYIITDGAGLGEQVYRFPIMGSENVLDAISNINGLPAASSPKRIWLARRTNGGGPYNIYPVDWKGITQQGAMATNWQIMPGDRIYVQADPMRRFNNNLSKMLEPIERILGVTLLGSQGVNSIRGINQVNR